MNFITCYYVYSRFSVSLNRYKTGGLKILRCIDKEVANALPHAINVIGITVEFRIVPTSDDTCHNRQRCELPKSFNLSEVNFHAWCKSFEVWYELITVWRHAFEKIVPCKSSLMVQFLLGDLWTGGRWRCDGSAGNSAGAGTAARACAGGKCDRVSDIATVTTISVITITAVV